MGSVDKSQLIEMRLTESANVKKLVAERCIGPITAAANLLEVCFRSGGKLMICGNGGSAADAQHMATELVSRLTVGMERPGLPAIALTTDTSFLTAFSNDVNFDGIFERQVQALGNSGDVLVGISTSGNSAYVVKAVDLAAKNEIKTIVLCGSGGKLSDMGDIVISVPNLNTQYIQESHIAIEHILCELIEISMYGTETK